MKTSTVDGVTYELPEGWEPIETVPIGETINLLYKDGSMSCRNLREILVSATTTAIAWQPITPLKVAKRYEVAELPPVFSIGPFVVRMKRTYPNIDSPLRVVSDRIPTRSQAERIAAIYEEGGSDE